MITKQFKLSVSEARAWDEDHKSDYLPLTEGALNQLPTKHRRGWTPAPDTTQLRRYEPPAKHGRDYEALTRAALKKPAGYWEDAPRGKPFEVKPLRRGEMEEGCFTNYDDACLACGKGQRVELMPDSTYSVYDIKPDAAPTPRGDLREKIAGMKAPEKPSADLDSLLAQAGIKFDGHVDEWMLRDCNVETRGNTWPEGRMWGQPIQLRLQLDNGKMRVDLGLFGIQHAGNEAKDYPFPGVIIIRPTDPLAPKGAGE